MSHPASPPARTPETAAQRAAAFARLVPGDAHLAQLGADLAAALALLAPLRDVRPEAGGGAVGVGAGGMPLRADAGPAYALARPPREFAPASRAGYVLVPHLAAGGPLGGPGHEPGGGALGAAAPGGDALASDALADDALAAEMELGA